MRFNIHKTSSSSSSSSKIQKENLTITQLQIINFVVSTYTKCVFKKKLYKNNNNKQCTTNLTVVYILLHLNKYVHSFRERERENQSHRKLIDLKISSTQKTKH